MSEGQPQGAVVKVAVESDVSHARRLAFDLASRIGFGRPAIHRLATVVSELGNNLVFHTTGGGQVSLNPLHHGGRWGIELVVEDAGPGIADLALAMTDGYSTNRGLGGGLPGSRRLMDEFEIESAPGRGTRVVARLWR
ncbi:MAG TPA: anti-sigma regulatory factor [Skermanella sp.]|jgi:serine/threonine-protein kinase RsbT|nr:anti-sigma regulatory factor [Skermanella sp.]